MKTRNARRGFKPLDCLPRGFKNLVLRILVQDNPASIQVTNRGKFSLVIFWSVLLRAAVLARSVPEAVKALKRAGKAVPTAKTIWNNVPFTPSRDIERAAAGTLLSLPRGCSKKTKQRLRRCKLLALDWTDQPFYGRKNAPGTIGRRKKASTGRCYRYLTAELVNGTFSYCTGIHLNVKGEKRSVEAVKLVEQARHHFRFTAVLADGAFFSGHFLAWLRHEGLDFCIRAPLRGIIAQSLDLVKHRVKRDGKPAFLPLVVIDRTTGRELPVVAAYSFTNGEYRCHVLPFVPRGSHAGLLRAYKRRFGIETGYRLIKSIYSPTCSTRPEVRLLLFFLAALVINCWRLADLWSWPEYHRRTVKQLHYRLTLVTFLDLFNTVTW